MCGVVMRRVALLAAESERGDRVPWIKIAPDSTSQLRCWAGGGGQARGRGVMG